MQVGKNLRNNLIISVVGMSFIIGAMGSVVKMRILILVSIGMCLMISGVFRTLGQIQEKLNQPEAGDECGK